MRFWIDAHQSLRTKFGSTEIASAGRVLPPVGNSTSFFRAKNSETRQRHCVTENLQQETEANSADIEPAQMADPWAAESHLFGGQPALELSERTKGFASSRVLRSRHTERTAYNDLSHALHPGNTPGMRQKSHENQGYSLRKAILDKKNYGIEWTSDC